MIQRTKFTIPLLILTFVAGCGDESGDNLSLQEDNQYKIVPVNQGGSDFLQRSVNLSSGSLFLSRRDQSSPYFQFERYYNSGASNKNKWSSIISSKIISAQNINTPSFSNKEEACNSGWDEIKDTFYLGVLSDGQAQYQDEACQVSLGDSVINIPIVSEESESKILFLPTGEHIFFEKKGSEWENTLNDGTNLHYNNNNFVLNHEGKVYTYSKNGLIKSSLHNGTLVKFTHDDSGNVTKAILPSGQAVTFHYADGQLNKVNSPYGEVDYSYNTSGLLAEVRHNGTVHETYEYDKSCSSCLSQVTDANGNVTSKYSYDIMNRVSSHNDSSFTRANA